MQTGDTNYIYKNELDKAYFQNDTAYGDFKDLEKSTQSDKALKLLSKLKSKLLKLQTIQIMMNIKED